MKIAPWGFLLFALLGWSSTQANHDLPDAVAGNASGRFRVSADPGYLDPRATIKYLLAIERANRERNRFCVVGYKFPSGNELAWVVWEEERLMMLWDPSLYADTRLKALTRARRNLKLGRDTVATENDINGSTYIVTVDWWISIADDCRKHGEQYEIEPFRIAPSKTSDPR